MYRRTVSELCYRYQIPSLARVGIFPIHLDPPTQQHQEIFKLLLGITEKPSLPLSQPPPSAAAATVVAAGSASLSQQNATHSLSSSLQQGTRTSSGNDRRMPSKFWYLESFAENLRNDSQLTPFDHLILVPNTRYPVSLRQSTHLAALSVLAARGIPCVHVDFTALEHPDDSMPVVYELAQRYHNSVLVHWLHDAYEMLNWRNFSDIKMFTPLLLLQANSLPVSAVTKPPPPSMSSSWSSPPSMEGDYTAATGATPPYAAPPVDRHATATAHHHHYGSRLYQDPRRIKDGYFADYYAKAAEHIQAQLQYREQQSHPALRRQHQRYGGPVGAGDTSGSAASLHGERASRGHAFDERGGNTAGAGGGGPIGGSHLAGNVEGNDSTYGGAADGAGRRPPPYSAAVNDVDSLVRGEWWLTKGGRGDDRVEVSRSYSNAASSSWLGAPIPLGKERMGIDVTADAILGDDGEDGMGRHPQRPRHDDNDAERDDDSDDDADFEEDDDDDMHSGGSTMDNITSDYIVTERGLVEVTQQRDHARAAFGEEAAAAAAAATAQTELPWSSSPTTHHGDGKEVVEKGLDPNEARSLFKEFAEVRASLEGMVEPLQICSRPASSLKASRRGGTDAETRRYREDGPAKPKGKARRGGNGDGSWGRGGGGGGHRVLDPNSVMSRRNVRELLEEIFPSLYFNRLYHRHQQQQRSPATATSPGGSGMDKKTNFAALRSAVASATPSLFASCFSPSGAPSSVAAQTDALLDEVALLQQSRTFPSHSSPYFPPSSLAAALASDPASSARDPASLPHGFAEEFLASAAATAALPDVRTLPMVEVHPVTRCTGADVRQLLWEQDVSPTVILTDAVTKYVESHGLYRDARKSADGGIGGNHAGPYPYLFTPGGGGGEAGSRHRPGHGHDVSAREPAASMLGTGNPHAAGARFPSSHPGGGSASAAATMQSNYNALKRMMMSQKEHAVMSFPGIIPRLELHYDNNNLLAREQYEKLKVFQCQDTEAPDLIVPIGGDGYMMHCIRNNWRRFIPFYGVNAGHVGYLLNDCATLEELFSSPLKLHTTNMLYCQAEKETETGERVLLSELAFNDAWVERSSGQTALIRILINGEERIRRLRGDGVLVSTAAGSTAYSQALGASPVPVGAPLIQVVGSNVVSPAQWRPVHLDQEDQVEFEVIDNIKRPCKCYVDSVEVGNVTRMLVRSSRVAGVTLAFSRSCDLQHKLYQVQFPKTL